MVSLPTVDRPLLISIFHNSNLGLLLSGTTTNSGNHVYNNKVGIQLDFGSSGSVTNNIVYNNTVAGIQVYGAGYYGGTPTIGTSTRQICVLASLRRSCASCAVYTAKAFSS